MRLRLYSCSRMANADSRRIRRSVALICQLLVCVLCSQSIRADEPELTSAQQYSLQQVTTLSMRADDLSLGGQDIEAAKLQEEALSIAEKNLGRDHLETVKALHNLASTYDRLGYVGKALPMYLRALAAFEKMGGTQRLNAAYTLNNLAMLYVSVGKFDNALPLFERSLRIREEELGPWDEATASGVGNLGSFYKIIGDYQKALPLLERALTIGLKTAPNEARIGFSAVALASVYAAVGNYDKALPLAQRSLAIYERQFGADHPQTGLGASYVGELYAATGQHETALPLHKRALLIIEKGWGPEHQATAISLRALADTYKGLGKRQTALPLYERALSIGLRWPEVQLRAEYASSLCSWHRENAELDLAAFYCKLGVNAYQQARQGSRGLDPELQRSLTSKAEPTYQELAKLLIQGGRIAEAEQVLGMLKEYEFFEFVRRSEKRDVRSSRSDFTPEEKALADRLEANARELSRIYGEREKLRKLKTLSTEQQGALKQLDEQSRSENEKLVKLFADIKTQLAQQQRPDQAERAKGLVETKGKTNATLLSLRQTSNTNPALIYFLPEDKSTLFLIHTKDGLRQVQSKPEQGGLGEQALNEKITLLRQLIEKRDNSYRKVANELYMALIAPVEPYLKDGGVDMVMLYLTDALRYLPFAALYDEASGQHLIEKYPLAVYTHVAQDTLTQQPQPQWAAVGLGTSQKTARHAALPWVKTELARVVRDAKDPQPAGVLAGKRYLDNDFTNAVFMQLMSGEHTPAVMHIATHFSLAPGNDQNSSLVLGNGDEVTLAEIAANAQLGGYELITLSACETAVGGGKVKDKAVGAEVEGLGAVLQKQGAKAVMATLWKVEDTGTALFMEQFYKARGEQRKTTKAQALREAQQALLSGKVKASDPAKHDLRHPYYWAPFILMGNWL